MERRTFIRLGLMDFLLLLTAACGGNGGSSSNGNGRPQQKIVFTGASTISRFDWGAYFRIPITNCAQSGIESRQLSNTIASQVSSKPDKLFFLIGTNNILNRHESDLDADIPAIINTVRSVSRATAIFCISMLPVRDAFSCGLMEIYNNRIQSVCNSMGVKFLSRYSMFKSSSTIIEEKYYIGDGIHLNDTGYQLLADSIRGDVMS
jgi:lysophospholipase L1-like esterase